MVNESTQYDGENMSMYKIDWDENDGNPAQERFNGVHVSPILYEDDDLYLFITYTPTHPEEQGYEGTVPFEEVQDALGAPYDDIKDENISLLGAEDIGSKDLPDDVYEELRETAGERGFVVNTLAATYREPIQEKEQITETVAPPRSSISVVVPG